MDKKNKTIRKEISKLFLVIAVVISVAMLTFTITTINNILEKHIEEDMSAAVQSKSETIVSSLKNGIYLITQFSSEIMLRNSLLAAITQGNDFERFGTAQTNIDKDIDMLLMSSTNLVNVKVYDVNSDLIANSGKLLESTGFINEFDAKSMIDELENFSSYKISDYYVIGGQVYSNFIVPVKHPENSTKPIGFLVATYRCHCIVNNYKKYPMFGKTGEFILAQKQKNKIVVLSALRHKNSLPGSVSYSVDAIKQNIVVSAFKGVSGNLQGGDYRGQDILGSYIYLAEFNIGVIAKIDKSEVFEDVKWVFTKVVAILCIAIVLGYLLVSKRLGRALAPISELEHGARRFSLGELNYRIPIYGNNELSQLTRLFNVMAEKLDKVTLSKNELDKQVEKQRQVERELHAERAKLEAIFESNKDSIVVWDTDYRHIYVNGAASNQVDIPKRNMLGKTISEVFEGAPEIAQFWMQKVEKVFSGGEVIESQDKTNFKGKVIYGESVISPILNEQDEIIAVGMVFRDITQRKYAEEAAAASWSMLHHIIDSIPVRVFWKDINSIYLGANKNFAKSIGMASPEEVIGKSDYELCVKKHAEEYIKEDNEIITSKKPKLNYEQKYIDESGKQRIINISKVPLIRSDGTVYGILGCFQDITERIEFIEKLQQTERKADLANKSKTDFLASMSHEIRTPINAMVGMADVLLQTGVNSNQSEYIKILKAAGENLSHLVGNILDYTKIESGELELHNAEFSLGDALNDSVNLVMLKTHEKNIYLNMNVDDEVQLKLYGDSGKLKQIILNLLNNAAKFTNTGGIDLKVSEWQHASPGKYMLLFEVIDTGPGIHEDKIETIFDRFTQLDDGVHGSDSSSGAGLGLSICQELVSVLEGSIWVESELGNGCKFSFTAAFKPMDELKVIRHQSYSKLSLRGTIAKVCCNDPDLSEQMIKNLEDWSIRAKHATGPQKECFDKDCDFIILIADSEMVDYILENYQKDQLVPAAHNVVLIPQNVEAEKLERLKNIGLTKILNLPVVRKDLYECLDDIHKSKGEASRHNSATNNKFTWYDPARVRVLIADDDPITKKVMRLAFENMGYRVDIVSNGNEVLTILKHNIYDIIFMDTDMPEMDGNETTKLIREQEQDSERRVPIVAVTAKVFDDDRKRAFDSGVDWFLPKPVIVEQMVEAINKLVKF